MNDFATAPARSWSLKPGRRLRRKQIHLESTFVLDRGALSEQVAGSYTVFHFLKAQNRQILETL